MRRARFKLAPNIGLATRPTKTEPSTSVDIKEPPIEVSSSGLDSIAAQEPCISVNADANVASEANLQLSTPTAQIVSLPPDVTPPVILQTNHVTDNITPSIDKENVKKVVSDVVPSENLQTNEDQNQSGNVLSRYKARNKVRPVIDKDARHRIRTFSGASLSASESEDDAGKRQSRTPLSPVKKPALKKDNVDVVPQPPKTENTKRGKKKPTEKTPLELKKAAMRKKFASGEVDRSQLTMFDLIYYNPTNGERPPKEKEKLQMRLKPYELEALSKEDKTEENKEESTGNAILDDLLAEEEEIRLDEETPVNKEEIQPSKVEESCEEEEEAMPVPQVRLGPDGEIILDDQSLVIDTSETKRNKKQLANAPVIIENSATLVNYGSWRKRQRSARWSLRETARFYRALSMLGTNFSLMERLFPNRPRVELKRKFKNEEKTNPQLVDKIISNQIPFDPAQFLNDEDLLESEAESTKKNKTKKDPKNSTKETKAKKGKEKTSVVNSDAGECNETPNESSEESEKRIAKKQLQVDAVEIENEMETDDIVIEKTTTVKSGASQRGKKTADLGSEATSRRKNSSKESKSKKRKSKKDVICVESESGDCSEVLVESSEEGEKRRAKKRRKAVAVESTSEAETGKTAPKKASKSTKPRQRARKIIDSESEETSRRTKTTEGSASPGDEEDRLERAQGASCQPVNDQHNSSHFTAKSTPLDNLMKSPLGQMSLEQGGLTIVEDPEAPDQAPSFLVPPALAQANTALAQAGAGGLVLMTEPNPQDPNNQLVHVYRVSVPVEPVSH